jgi:hypothetical protein
VIFIGLFIIRFSVINVQIGKVRKHGTKTPTIISIPCPTILNDIFFSEIGTYKKNGNLMFTQVSTQCPFTCATNILWWKEVGPYMSYLDVVGFVPSMHGQFHSNHLSHGWH